jgi:peptidyl-prolyl cis-trans isomerase-like 3
MAVTLTIDGLGSLKFELFCEKTPITCRNFLALCASDYYIGTEIHRNIKNFIVQGGDPTGTGKGGQSIYGEPFQDEIDPELRHDKRGVLSMANSGLNKNTSQFFITYGKHPTLDNKFTVFGQLVDGF